MIGKRILQFDQLDSTNNYVAKALRSSEYEFGTVILAHFQTKGRGQRRSEWQSEAGKNLTFSFALPLQGFDPRAYYLISMAIALGLNEGVSSLVSPISVIKWPNDILISKRKVAGMLIETVSNHAVCGIGLNVNQIKFSYQAATSLRMESKKDFDRMEVLKILLHEINREWEVLSQGDFRTMQQRFANSLFGMNQAMKLTSDDKSFTGIIKGVGADGKLIVNIDGKEEKYLPKEVSIDY